MFLLNLKIFLLWYCLFQVLVSILFLNLLHLLDLAPLKPYSRPLGERLLVPAVCSGIHGVLAMWAKASSSSAGLYPLTLPLLPLVTVGFSVCLKLASPPSVHISVGFSILSLTSFVITGKNRLRIENDGYKFTSSQPLFSLLSAVAQGLAGVDTLEYIYAPLALLLHSISLTWLAKVSEAERRQPADAQASVFDIYYTQLVNQSWVLGLLWLLHPDSPWQVLGHSSWRTLLFHGYLLAILLLGMVLNFLVGVSALCVSPLAAAVLHSARQVVQPFIHLL